MHAFDKWPLMPYDSGKTSLINSFINYIFYVNLEDPFRFQLIDESQAESRISVYNLRATWRSLKIIRTPSYVENDANTKNQGITEMIRNF